MQGRRLRSGFRARAEVAFAENDSGKMRDLVERVTACQSYFDIASGRRVPSEEACRQGCGVIGNYYVAGTEEVNKFRARMVADVPATIYDQQFRVRWALDRNARRDHTSSSRMISAISSAATAGGFKVAGSAPGTAAACIGVSMSPGSSERTRTPRDVSS